MEFWLGFGVWAKRICDLPFIFLSSTKLLKKKKKNLLALGECVQLVAAKFCYRKFCESLILAILKRARGNKAACVITSMFSVDLQNFKFIA